jgi:exosortase A-associated hydrolase 1
MKCLAKKMSSQKETAHVIECNGSPMIGVLHQPEKPKGRGIVVVVAGGPQYRVGCARQIIYWSRKLAEAGYPVLRFDYRGFGDSGGEFVGFENIDDDIAAAIALMNEKMPELKELVLWGECNAASSIFKYAWRDPKIKGIISQNPWVRDEGTQAKTYLKHYYLYRLGQKSFWEKLLKLKFNPVKSLLDMFALWKTSKLITETKVKADEPFWDSEWSYQVHMREGMARYNHKLLLFMSGKSLIGKEFDELVAGSDRWKEVMEELDMKRIDEPDADHTFSRQKDKDKLINNAIEWLDSW